MPAYPFLFHKNKAGEGDVPNAEATQLLAYLNSMRMDLPLYEAPFRQSITNQPLHKMVPRQ
jgi:hypothetical protein